MPCAHQTNFCAEDYAGEAIPRLSGKTREEVKTTLKSERIKVGGPGWDGTSLEGGFVGGVGFLARWVLWVGSGVCVCGAWYAASGRWRCGREV